MSRCRLSGFTEEGEELRALFEGLEGADVDADAIEAIRSNGGAEGGMVKGNHALGGGGGC